MTQKSPKTPVNVLFKITIQVLGTLLTSKGLVLNEVTLGIRRFPQFAPSYLTPGYSLLAFAFLCSLYFRVDHCQVQFSGFYLIPYIR